MWQTIKQKQPQLGREMNGITLSGFLFYPYCGTHLWITEKADSVQGVCEANGSIDCTCYVYNKSSYLLQGITVAEIEKSRNTPAGYRHAATSRVITDMGIISGWGVSVPPEGQRKRFNSQLKTTQWIWSLSNSQEQPFFLFMAVPAHLENAILENRWMEHMCCPTFWCSCSVYIEKQKLND